MATDSLKKGDRFSATHQQMLEFWIDAIVYVTVDGKRVKARIVTVNEADVELVMVDDA